MYDDTNNVSRMPNYVDDKKDPNQNIYESKIENDVCLYFSHWAVYSVVRKTLGLVCVTLMPIWFINHSMLGSLASRILMHTLDARRLNIWDICVILGEAWGLTPHVIGYP